jgi:plastocyanin
VGTALALVLAVALSGVACGGSGGQGGGGSPIPTTCTPGGATIDLSAKGIAFHPTFLCAPGGQALTIAFDNQDSAIPHNVSIWKGDFASRVFDGAVVTGPKMTDYQVAALAPGVYRFRCDLHPTQMTGALVVAPGP